MEPIILGRIREALQEKIFKPQPKHTKKTVKNLGDMTQDYDDFFEKGASLCATPWTGLRPAFTPIPRQTSKPILPPKKLVAPPKMLPQGLFHAFKGVWDYYAKNEQADPKLKDLPITTDGMFAFLDQLCRDLPYPLQAHLECLESIDHMEMLCLVLPSMSYDDDAAGLVEAFLNGPKDVAGMMMHLDKDDCLKLSKQNRALVKKMGYILLTEHYASYEGKKVWDLQKFEDWFETFFGWVEKKYPNRSVGHIAIISGDGHEEIEITSAEDIEFAIDYEKAYDTMMGSLPNVWRMEDPEDADDQHAEEFIKDMCKVWRRAHK